MPPVVPGIILEENNRGGRGYNNCMSPPYAPSAELGLWVSANSIVNITTANSLQKSILLADEKDPQDWSQVVVWVIHIYLLHLLVSFAM